MGTLVRKVLTHLQEWTENGKKQPEGVHEVSSGTGHSCERTKILLGSCYLFIWTPEADVNFKTLSWDRFMPMVSQIFVLYQKFRDCFIYAELLFCLKK